MYTTVEEALATVSHDLDALVLRLDIAAETLMEARRLLYTTTQNADREARRDTAALLRKRDRYLGVDG